MSEIIFTEPNYSTEYDKSKYELFRMECNCRRMKWMIQNGYCVDEYTDEHWKRFKELLNQKEDE